MELRFNENRYGLIRGPINEPGKIVVQGDDIVFYSSLLCKGTGTYRWSLHEGSLTFTSIELDPAGAVRGAGRIHVHPVTRERRRPSPEGSPFDAGAGAGA